MEKLGCWVQGQGHSKISKCQWMFVQMISSESLNLLPPNMVWWFIVTSQIVFKKYWVDFFQVRVTVNNQMIKLLLSNISSEMLILLQSNLDDGTFLYAGVSCGKKMDYCVQGQDHSETSKCRWMFVRTISSELLNILLLNLVCCIIMSRGEKTG